MADLFVSYASEDRPHVRQLVQVLESQGWTVWWDRDIDAGSSFDKRIEAALDDAHVVVVVWSRASVSSDWVRAEATEGLERNALIPILLDEVKPPLLFRQKQAISLVDWKRDASDAEALQRLLPSIRGLLERDRASTLPVSTQRSWVLGRTDNCGAPIEMANATNVALDLGLSYFDNLFVYSTDYRGQAVRALASEQLQELVDEEGLDGFLFARLQPEGENLRLTLQVTKGGETTGFDHVGAAADFGPSWAAACLMQAATLLQDSEPAQIDLMRQFLEERSTAGLHHMWRATEQTLRFDYQAVERECLQALECDPGYVQVHRALATAYQYLGRKEESRQAIARTIAGTDKESRRSAIMGRAMYYAMHSEDYEKASHEFEQLVKLSPLDSSGINNLAVSCFYTLDFKRAKELALRDLALYPMKTFGLQNSAFYSFYDSDFDEADRLARSIYADNQSYVTSLVISALVCARNGDLASAEALYRSAETGPDYTHGALLQGRADLALARGDLETAEALLVEAIEKDEATGNAEYGARKLLMRAEIALRRNDTEGGLALCDAALRQSTSTATLAACLALHGWFDLAPSVQLARHLKQKINAHGRALLKALQALEACHSGELGDALLRFDEAVAICDLWIVRFLRAYAFRSAGLVLEAADEFAILREREGEALSAALDEQPTLRLWSATRS